MKHAALVGLPEATLPSLAAEMYSVGLYLLVLEYKRNLHLMRLLVNS